MDGNILVYSFSNAPHASYVEGDELGRDLIISLVREYGFVFNNFIHNSIISSNIRNYLTLFNSPGLSRHHKL